MTVLKIKILFIIFCFINLTNFAQTLKTIDSLQNQYQQCLDKGEYMLGCSKMFYYQIDSLLNLRYKKLRLTCDSIQKENLKDEQLEWLAKRDKQFIKNQKQTNKEAKKEGYDGGQDERMILTDTNAMFVKQRVIELVNSSALNYSADKYKVNPTGLYSLDNKTTIKNDDTYGYFGDIAVKAISQNKVVVRLYVCKGAPSYNSGTLADTLEIKNNKAIYTNAEFDSTCKIIFSFFRQGIKVEEFTDNYNSGCGFGHAVVADGFFKKKSNKIPTTKELTDE
jgi:uncharacterized protein YecT (DUF1311 family)